MMPAFATWLLLNIAYAVATPPSGVIIVPEPRPGQAVAVASAHVHGCHRAFTCE